MGTEDTLKKRGSVEEGRKKKGCWGGGLRAGKPEHVSRLTETAMLCRKTGSRKMGTIKGDGSG